MLLELEHALPADVPLLMRLGECIKMAEVHHYGRPCTVLAQTQSARGLGRGRTLQSQQAAAHSLRHGQAGPHLRRRSAAPASLASAAEQTASASSCTAGSYFFCRDRDRIYRRKSATGAMISCQPVACHARLFLDRKTASCRQACACMHLRHVVVWLRKELSCAKTCKGCHAFSSICSETAAQRAYRS